MLIPQTWKDDFLCIDDHISLYYVKNECLWLLEWLILRDAFQVNKNYLVLNVIMDVEHVEQRRGPNLQPLRDLRERK